MGDRLDKLTCHCNSEVDRDAQIKRISKRWKEEYKTDLKDVFTLSLKVGDTGFEEFEFLRAIDDSSFVALRDIVEEGNFVWAHPKRDSISKL